MKHDAFEDGHKSAANCLSPSSALALIRKALTAGRVEFRSYFKMRMQTRDFTSLDMERVFRLGAISDPPEHSIEFNNWRYRVRASIDGYSLEIVVAIDYGEDLDDSPLIIPITGFWSGKGTKHGKRQD